MEAQLELLSIRCPRCAGQLVLRVEADERGRSVQLTIDTACVACGTSPWNVSDERVVTFTPGAPIATTGDLGAAQARIDALLRRVDSLERDLGSAQRNLERAEQRRRTGEVEQQLREEISHLEEQLAEARAEIRRAEEATRGEVTPGKRAIEVE